MNEHVQFQQINCRITSKLYIALAKMALAANLSPTAYATNLLNAAYAAKCGPTGDSAMEAAVHGVDMAGEVVVLKAKLASLEAIIIEDNQTFDRLKTELAEAYAESNRLEAALKVQDEKAAKQRTVKADKFKVAADVLVKAVVIGFGTGLDSKQIADRIGVSEPFVTKTLDAWRNEIQSRKAA